MDMVYLFNFKTYGFHPENYQGILGGHPWDPKMGILNLSPRLGLVLCLFMRTSLGRAGNFISVLH